MIFGSIESRVVLSNKPALYTLAETMCDTPGGFDRYNYAKCVWLGNPDRRARLNGEHPWPTRVHNQEQYIYSVPVLASIDPATGTMLYVGKDNWKPVDDPNGWLVAERHLLRGEEIEHRVLSASVDAARDVRLSLAPAGYSNFPPQMRWALASRPPYAQTMLEGRLDECYNLQRATLREGMEGSTEFEDIEALESMIVFIQQLRQVEAAEAERERVRDMVLGLGEKGIEGAALQVA